MGRSGLKGPYISYHLIDKIEKIEGENKQIIQTWSRASTILPIMIGHTICIYNGKKHIPVFITESLIGHKLGEFAPTRNFHSHKKIDRKIKR